MCIACVPAHGSAPTCIPRLPTIATSPGLIAHPAPSHGDQPSWRSRPPSLTARAGRTRAAATWTPADGRLTASALRQRRQHIGSGGGGASGVHAVGRDGWAALPARSGRAEVSMRALHVLGHGTQAIQASTTEACAWRRYLLRVASLVVRVGPPSPAARPGPIHRMGRAQRAIRHTVPHGTAELARRNNAKQREHHSHCRAFQSARITPNPCRVESRPCP